MFHPCYALYVLSCTVQWQPCPNVSKGVNIFWVSLKKQTTKTVEYVSMQLKPKIRIILRNNYQADGEKLGQSIKKTLEKRTLLVGLE